MTEERAPHRRPPRQSPILGPIPRALRIPLPRPTSASLPSGATLVALALAAAYAAARMAIVHARLGEFALRDPVLPAYTQALWAILTGSTRATLLDRPLLADHLPFALLALLPAFAIFRSPTFLLTAQTAALAAGAIVLFRIADRRIGGTALPLAIVAAYLLHPAIGGGIERFSVTALAVPFLVGAHVAYLRDRRRALAACLAVAALVRYELALFAAGYGALLLAHRRGTAAALAIAAGGLGYAACARTVLAPLFGGAAHDGTAAAAAMAMPVGALATWDRWLQSPALVPLTFILIVECLAALRRRAPGRAPAVAIGVALIAGAAGAAILAGRAGLPGAAEDARAVEAGARAPAIATRRALLDMIPGSAPVIASAQFLPHVAQRAVAYDVTRLPANRPRHIQPGRPGEPAASPASDARYALVDWAEVVFGPTTGAAGDSRITGTLADGTWRVLYAAGNVTLLHRGAAAPAIPEGTVIRSRGFLGEPKLYETLPESALAGTRPLALFGGQMELLDAREVVDPAASGDRIHVALTWRLRAASPAAEYRARVRLVDARGDTLASLFHPIAYNIDPPSRWSRHEAVREHIWIAPSTPPGAERRAIAVGVEAGDPARPLPCETLAPDVVLDASEGQAALVPWTRP